jgi:membrane protease YdiL (CAAX protease family)
MPDPADHLLFVLIAALYPLYSTFVWYRRLRPRLEAGRTGALVRFYGETVIELWLLTAAVLSWWFWAGRTSDAIGLGIPGGRAFWIGVVVVAGCALVLGLQLTMVRSSAEARAKVRNQLAGSTGLIVPRSNRERRMAVAAGLTAGFCEEVLYRAYFMGYLIVWLPGAAAVAISAAVFGMAHVYQGRGGAAKATAAGAIFGAAYLLTRSLWVPIALHATVDVAGLLTGSIAFGPADSASEEDHINH